MGARKRLPVHPMLSRIRTLGTLAVLFAMLGTTVTTSRATAQVDGNAGTGDKYDWSIEWSEADSDPDVEEKSAAVVGDAPDSAAVRDDERTPNIFADSDKTDDGDRDYGRATESGIDGNEYISPTYGFSVEWDDEVWTAAADEELVNEFPDGSALDRLVLDTEGAALYIEGRTDFDDGDLEACVDRDIDTIGQSSEISNLDIREDENGDQMVGKTADSAFKVVTLTMDDTNFTEYIECRPIDEGESVLVITLITKASNLDNVTDDMHDVVETIVI